MSAIKIHRQNAGPGNVAVGKVGFDPYIGSEVPDKRSITIDGDAQGFAGSVIPEFTLYNMLTDGKYAPRFVSGAMTSITNSTNMECDVPNAMRPYLAVNDLVKFYDASAGALSTDSITVDAISAADGGTGGTGFTKITCTGQVFSATPVSTGDLLVLADGSELDSDIVLVDEEVDLTDSVDQVVSASYTATLKKSLINRADNINKADLAGREFYIRNE